MIERIIYIIIGLFKVFSKNAFGLAVMGFWLSQILSIIFNAIFKPSIERRRQLKKDIENIGNDLFD